LLVKHLDSYNVVAVAEFLAALDSARFYERMLLRCVLANSDLHLLELAVSWRQAEGLIMEFGVASGRTINHIATLVPDLPVYGFDSFEGLPEVWRPGFAKHTFAQPTPDVRPNVTLVKGWFEQSLPGFLADHPGTISLLHVDCDLYSSTRTIFEHLGSRIVAGTVIVFDEYFNYPGWRQHEHRAFQEYAAANGRRYEYLGIVPRHAQVCLRITA
jgi:predicted O-methyltransferase YrrM